MGKSGYHHKNLKEEMIKNGIKIIGEEGYGKFSMRKVAGACGVMRYGRPMRVSHGRPFLFCGRPARVPHGRPFLLAAGRRELLTAGRFYWRPA